MSMEFSYNGTTIHYNFEDYTNGSFMTKDIMDIVQDKTPVIIICNMVTDESVRHMGRAKAALNEFIKLNPTSIIATRVGFLNDNYPVLLEIFKHLGFHDINSLIGYEQSTAMILPNSKGIQVINYKHANEYMNSVDSTLFPISLYLAFVMKAENPLEVASNMNEEFEYIVHYNSIKYGKK